MNCFVSIKSQFCAIQLQISSYSSNTGAIKTVLLTVLLHLSSFPQYLDFWVT